MRSLCRDYIYHMHMYDMQIENFKLHMYVVVFDERDII